MDAYQAALAGSTAPRIEIGASRTKPGSVAAAVALYFGSMAFGNLGPSTQSVRRRILERFREAYGERLFKGLERPHIEAMLAGKIATPHAARHFLNALRAVTGVAITANLRNDDPTVGIRVKVRDTGGFRTWTDDELAQFEAVHPIGSRARLAFALLLWTAQRRGDVIRMGRQHVRDGYIHVRQQKTGRPLWLPILPPLQEVLDAHPAGHLTFLTTKAGEPFSASGFTSWFRAMRRDAGLPAGLSAHGLRKARSRQLAEVGCSANQIAAITGHATLREVERYTKAADQKRLATAAAAMEAVSQKTKVEQKTGKPSGKVCQTPAQPIESKGPGNEGHVSTDSSVSPTHSVWNGHYACICYHPLFVFNQFGDLERCALRPGNVHSADVWESVLKPVVERYKWKVSRIYFRADAGFANPEVYEYLEAERVKYAIRLPANRVLQERIGYLLQRPVGRPSNDVRRSYANFTYHWRARRRD